MYNSILVFCGCIHFIYSLPANSKPANETRYYVHKTLSALESALHFLDKDHMYVNLDAIIGTRIVDGKSIYYIFEI